MVKKKDGRLERFNIDKMMKGLQKACEKRPVTLEQMRDNAEKVRQSIMAEGREAVSSKGIGDNIIAHLKELDYVGYVRFAPAYREFREPEGFMKIVEEDKRQAFHHLNLRKLVSPSISTAFMNDLRTVAASRPDLTISAASRCSSDPCTCMTYGA